MCSVLQDGELWGLFESEFITLHVAAMWGSGSVKLQVWGGDTVESLQARVRHALQVSVDQKWSELTLHAKVRGKYEQLQPDYSLSYYFKAGSEHEVKVGCMLRGGGKPVKKAIGKHGTAAAAAGAKKRGSKAQDDDDDEDNSDDEEQTDRGNNKLSEVIKQFTMELVLLKSKQGYTNSSVMQQFVAELEVLYKLVTTDTGKSEAILTMMKERLTTQQCNHLVSSNITSNRHVRLLAQQIAKTVFEGELETLEDTKETCDGVAALYGKVISVGYMQRYNNGGRLQHGLFNKDMLAIFEQQVRADAVAQPAAVGRGVLARLLAGM